VLSAPARSRSIAIASDDRGRTATTATTRGELDGHDLQIDVVDEVDKKQKPFGAYRRAFAVTILAVM
jgi:hypothetical protein